MVSLVYVNIILWPSFKKYKNMMCAEFNSDI